MATLPVSNGLVAMLAGLFAVELIVASQWRDAQPPVPPGLQAVSAESGSFGYPPPSAFAAWRDETLARPLFAPSRAPAAPSQLQTARISRLSGIMITPTEKIAVFSPAAGGPIIVTKNGRFGPFQVLSIAPDSVTVKGPDGVIVLRPDVGDQGQMASSTPAMTILPGGIAVHLISVALGTAPAD